MVHDHQRTWPPRNGDEYRPGVLDVCATSLSSLVEVLDLSPLASRHLCKLSPASSKKQDFWRGLNLEENHKKDPQGQNSASLDPFRMADMSQADESQTDYVALMEEVPTAAENRLRSCY